MINWAFGTVGFSYKDWNGVFYPDGAPPRSYLAHYSRVFDAVEIDSTFYGTPPTDRVRQWASLVPETFTFCIKTPREITHDQRLRNAETPMSLFLDTVRILDQKLGAILIQLPPSFTASEFDTVDAFLAALPSDLRYSIEFRHESWFVAETALMLEAHNVGWTAVDYLNLPKQIALTSDFLYIRWLGRHGQFEQKDHVQADVTPQLEWWHSQIEPLQARVDTIYGFFNNDFSGHSPATCNQFKAMMGLPVTEPVIPKQAPLFEL